MMYSENTTINDLVLKDFLLGEIPCKTVQFQFNHLNYLMLFIPISETQSEESIADKSNEMNIDYRPNSYDIIFDLEITLTSEQFEFFTPPVRHLAFQNEFEQGRRKIANKKQIFELKEKLVQCLLLHYQISQAECYFFKASHQSLKRFYDGIVHDYADVLGFQVRIGFDPEGLAYELKTTHFQSASDEN